MAAGVLTRPVWTRPVRTVLIALVAPLGAFLQEGDSFFHVLFRMPFLPPFGPSGQFRRQHSGVLDAGTYNLFASAGAAFGGGDSHAVLGYSIALDLAPTPEPGTLALFGTALLGFVARSSTRKKSTT